MNTLRKFPFVFLLIPLIVAILCVNKHKPNVLWNNDYQYSYNKAIYTAQILNNPTRNSNYIKIVVNCLQLTDSLFSTPTQGKLLVFLENDSLANTLVAGDIVNLYIKPIKNNTTDSIEFNYGNYLQQRGIYAQAFCHKSEWQFVAHSQTRGLKAHAQKAQLSLFSILEKAQLDNSNLGVLAALTIGERNYLDNTTKNMFAAAGAMHVLAVSGLHVGIINNIILILLTCFGFFPILYKQHKRKILCGAITITLLWIYAFITGLSPSVVRATLMFSILNIGYMSSSNTNSYNIVAAAAFITLCINPTSLFSISFQLSYAAVFSIICFQPKLNNLISVQNKILKYIWNLTTLSFAVQIGTLPITLWYFYQTSNYFWLTNLIVVPMAEIIIAVAVLYFIIHPLLIAKYVALLLNLLLSFLRKYVAFIDSLPFSTTNMSITTPMLITLLVIITLLIVYTNIKKNKWLPLCGIFMLATAFCCLHFAHLKKISSKNQTIVYNSKDIIIFNQQGNKCSIITTNPTKAIKQTNNIIKQQMLKTDTLICIDNIPIYSFKTNSKHWLILQSDTLHNKHILASAPEVDYIIYSANWNNSFKSVFNNWNPHNIITTPNIPPYAKLQLEKVAENKNINIFETPFLINY